MGKCMKRVRDWTDKQDERLRRKLEALPQRTKLAVVLVIFTFSPAAPSLRSGRHSTRSDGKTDDR